MKVVRGIARFFFVVMLSSFITIVLVEDEPWVKEAVQGWFNTFFGQMYVCEFSSRVDVLHLLSGKVALRDMLARDHYGRWQWQARSGYAHFSLLDIIRYGTLRLHIVLDDCSVSTQINERGMAIVPHFVLMAQPAEDNDLVPVVVSSIKIRSVFAHGFWPGTMYELKAEGRCNLDTTPDSFKSSLLVGSFSAFHGEKELVNSDAIVFESAVDFDPFGKESASLHASCVLPYMSGVDRTVSAHVHWDKKETCLSIESEKKDVDIQANLDHSGFLKGSWRLPIGYVLGFIAPSLVDQCSAVVSGSCSCDCDWVDRTLCSDITISNIGYKSCMIPDVTFKLISQKQNIGLLGEASCGDICDCVSSYDALSKQCNTSVVLKKPVGLPYGWELSPDLCKLSFSYDLMNNLVEGDYRCAFERDTEIEHGNKKHVISGVISADANKITCSGSHKENYFDVCVGRKPVMHIKHIGYNKAFCFNGDSTKFSACIDYSLIADCLNHFGIAFPGAGELALSGSLAGKDFSCDCAMHDGSIRLPGIYNIVTGLRGRMFGNYATGVYGADDVVVSLHEGSAEIPCAGFYLNNLGLDFAYVPISFSSCFVNYGKDIFAKMSGALTLQYRDKLWHCSGLCSIDESHMRANLLSQDFLLKTRPSIPQENVVNTCSLDIGIQTNVPLHIATSFLTGDLAADFRIRGTVGQPSFLGSVQFLHGTLQFPYAPLFITQGSLVFDADDILQSSIALRAENSVKKYAVNLDIVGTLDDPEICFDSSPSLEKEQIITLLLGGSEDGALYFVMPKALTNTLESLVFGSDDTVSFAQRSIRKFFKPFRNFWLVPSLSDQTGRGGLKGSVIIEVNERLKAIIEKNFSKPEATSVEVEYFLADEVNIRGFKDSWGDFGAEVEMRYGFGN